jgi:aspartate kinase
VIVYKFGGALARTRRGVEALAHITHLAHRSELARTRRSKQSGEQHGLVVVVSAIGHATRNLSRAAELAEDGKLIEAESLLDKIVAQHQQLATSLGLDEESLESAFEGIASSVRALLEGVAITRELSARSRDAILAHGESFALALIEDVLRERDLPIHIIDARNVIVTNEAFGHAAPDLTAVADRAHRLILPRLKRCEIVLVQGFVGATPDGITTTMGSESSDLTATLLAGALNAREVVIWKMLPGIYSADPELVPKAKLVRTLSFDEAEEIGRRGARVLYPTFAHPLLGSAPKTILRIAAPFAKTSRHTVLSRTIPNTPRKQQALTITLEDKLIVLRLSLRTTSKDMKKRSSLEELAGLALASWRTANEIAYVIPRETRRSFLRAVDREQYIVKDGEPTAALSIVFRKLKTDSLDAAFTASVARSLRTFGVRAILPVEQSLVVLINEADGTAALKKLHHDLFEG